MYSHPLAYLLTWTCHGTWLHGDERGSVDDRHNGYNTSRLRPNELMLRVKQASLHGVVRTLTHAERRTITEAVVAHCGIRKWHLLAQNPRSNHVHVVVSVPAVEPEKILRELKSWATRFLSKADSTVKDPWTDGGSTLYLFEQEDVDAAVHYVLVEQDRLERFVRPSELRKAKDSRERTER